MRPQNMVGHIEGTDTDHDMHRVVKSNYFTVGKASSGKGYGTAL